MTLRAGLIAALCYAGAVLAEPATIARDDGARVAAHWFAADAPGPRPAIVALHGCGGLYRRDGSTLDARYPEYVERLNAAGYHVLLPDSFGSRGAGSICNQKVGERAITINTRRDDVIAAVRWLAARADVDARRIALLGWSHGGTTALAALNAARTPHAAPLAGAAVFYPGCRGLLARPFRLDVPLLMLLGEQDDWTPAAHCVEFAQRTRAAFIVYPDSHHGFDSARPVRFRSDVSNGARGNGVHVGGNPAARAGAQRELDAFFARILQ